MSHNPRLKTPWIADLQDTEAKDQFVAQVYASKKVLDKLAKIVYNKVLDGEKVSVGDYDNPSWSHKQADRNGYLRALREVLELVQLGDHDQ